MELVRRAVIVALSAILVAGGVPARAQDTLVRVGYSPLGVPSIIFYIADRLGFFSSEGLMVDLLPFDSSLKQVAPLAMGDLDVSGSSPSATLYDTIGKGNGMRIVADIGRDPPGYGFESLVVRSDLLKSGRYKSAADLRGMRVALQATGVAYWATLVALLKTAGLSYRDIKPVILRFGDYVGALRDGLVDAALVPEPAATLIVRSGVAARINKDDSFYPNQEIVVLAYSGRLIKNRPDVGLRFMRAFLRAARFYNDGLADGKFSGPNAEAVVKMVVEATMIKDPDVIRESVPAGVDPNGTLNIASMKQDLATFRDAGLIRTSVQIERTVDPSFAATVVRQLGRYSR
jgi:NitT/TauT family transport system substrate-binding protein